MNILVIKSSFVEQINLDLEDERCLQTYQVVDVQERNDEYIKNVKKLWIILDKYCK